MTFENFRVTEGTEEAFNLCLDLANGNTAVDWITLMGKSDRGKTHLAIATVRKWLERQVPAKYAYVPLLLDELKAGFCQEGDESYLARFKTFCEVPLLVLDDLGVENFTPWSAERLNSLVDYRLMHSLPLVVTTNLPLKEIPFRIANRLQRRGKIVFLRAPSYHRGKLDD